VIDLRHQQVLLLQTRFLDDISARIDDPGTPETGELATVAGDVGANYPESVFDCQRDVGISCGGIQCR
jgi:hypothetical protein